MLKRPDDALFRLDAAVRCHIQSTALGKTSPAKTQPVKKPKSAKKARRLSPGANVSPAKKKIIAIRLPLPPLKTVRAPAINMVVRNEATSSLDLASANNAAVDRTTVEAMS
tara:strand:+ start:2102 stop:2434 length:333 start_codon:yes stop_codon:yes gene_type:complete